MADILPNVVVAGSLLSSLSLGLELLYSLQPDLTLLFWRKGGDGREEKM